MRTAPISLVVTLELVLCGAVILASLVGIAISRINMAYVCVVCLIGSARLGVCESMMEPPLSTHYPIWHNELKFK